MVNPLSPWLVGITSGPKDSHANAEAEAKRE